MLQTTDVMTRVAGAVQKLASRKPVPKPLPDHQMRLNPEKIDEIYEGPQGAMLALASRLSGNLGHAERILRDRQFNLRGVRSLLDVGSGAGQLAAPVLRYADRQAKITCCDRSAAMLLRARVRLESSRPRFVVADVTCLPFADGSFDGVTCGYVLEHLVDPIAGLEELSRVLTPGGKLLLMATEDNLSGKLTSHTWHCQALNRFELQSFCSSVGLVWKRAIHVPRWHQMPWIGGICVEIHKPRHSLRARTGYSHFPAYAPPETSYHGTR